jgi:hypothetical protein
VTFDWRDRPNSVTPVKDQQQCGSCWAFSATENIESVWAIQGGHNLTSLSVEQIVSCDKKDSGCNGGDLPTAFDYVMQARGLETEKDYPYTSGGGKTGVCKAVLKDELAQVDGWEYATRDKNETAMQVCVPAPGFLPSRQRSKKAPISLPYRWWAPLGEAQQQGLACIGVHVQPCPLGHLRGRIELAILHPWRYAPQVGSPPARGPRDRIGRRRTQSEDPCCPSSCGTQLDHCVQLVGWTTVDNVDAWTVRNSWNTDWGMQGVGLLRRGPISLARFIAVGCADNRVHLH